ncbi:MAG: hypothetical protein E7625_05360 [Ruminococcaceae bacterium]|nr:hypothetical protein [Oscillospiraceae bacterium]
MKQYLKKFTSRKFLLSVISMAAGLAALCGADETVVSIVAGAAMTALPAIVYCITEGRIDAASAKTIGGAVVNASAALGADRHVQDVLHAAGEMLSAMGEQDDAEQDP